MDLPAYNQDKEFMPGWVFSCILMFKNIMDAYGGKTRVEDIFSRVAELVLQPEGLFLFGSMMQRLLTHWSFSSL